MKPFAKCKAPVMCEVVSIFFLNISSGSLLAHNGT